MSDRDTLAEVYRTALEHLESECQPAGTDTSELLDLVRFVREGYDLELADDDFLVILDRLSRKIEITGTLHRVYDRCTMRPRSSGGLAPAPAVEALMCLLLEVFAVSRDFRYLNTVLKAADGVLHSPAIMLDHRLLAIVEDALQATPIDD